MDLLFKIVEITSSGDRVFDATRVLYGFALGREVKITEVQRTCGSVLKLARDDSAPDRGAKK